MKTNYFYAVLLIITYSCTGHKADPESLADFQKTTSFPVVYSCKVEGSQEKLIQGKQPLSIEQVKVLLASSEFHEDEKVFPLHIIKGNGYKLASFLIDDDLIPCYYDRLSIIIYDTRNTIAGSIEWELVPDEYGSYQEVIVNSAEDLITRYADHEYSPDEQQYEADLKSGYVFKPVIQEQQYVLGQDSLKFELIDTRIISE